MPCQAMPSHAKPCRSEIPRRMVSAVKTPQTAGSNNSPCISAQIVSRPCASTGTSIDAINFQAGKYIATPCEGREFPVDEYLSDAHRVVCVVFPDSKRLQYQGHQTWRARLRPVSFPTISATPVSDLRYEKVIRMFLTHKVASYTQKIVSEAAIHYTRITVLSRKYQKYV